MLKEVFSQILSYLLDQAKISRQTLADALGVSRAAVGQMANGVNLPSVEKLIAIADFFNVSTDFLLGRAKLYSEPEGELKYVFKGEKDFYVGRLHYIFGIVPYEEDRPKQFIVLEETEGNFLVDMQESYGVFMFLSLAYLLRAELGFDYDAYHNNGVDIVTKNKYGTYVEIAAEMAESAKACPLSFDEEIVEEWVSLPNKERINRLKQYYYLRSYQ